MGKSSKLQEHPVLLLQPLAIEYGVVLFDEREKYGFKSDPLR
jgi:hypothetical protein